MKYLFLLFVLTASCKSNIGKIDNVQKEFIQSSISDCINCCPNCGERDFYDRSYSHIINCNNCGIYCDRNLKYNKSIFDIVNPTKILFVIVHYDIHEGLGYGRPTISKVFDTYEKAQVFQQKQKLKYWSKLIDEGIKNESYEYYLPKLADKGHNFDKLKSQKEITKFYKYLESGTIFNEHTQSEQKIRFNLETVKIFVIEDMGLSKNKNRRIGFYCPTDLEPLQNSGIPAVAYSGKARYLFDDELELLAFNREVLRNKPMDVKHSAFWSSEVYFNDTMSKELTDTIKKLNIENPQKLTLEEIRNIKNRAEEIAQMDFRTFTGYLNLIIE